MDAHGDAELEALERVMLALKHLDDGQRERVLKAAAVLLDVDPS